jgi:hypothetical protein
MRASSFLGGICFLAKTLYHKGVGVLNFHLSLQNVLTKKEKQMKKVLLFFMVVMMIITSSATLVYGETSVEEFSDIENHWAKDIILNAKSQGWVDGYEDKTFQPDKSISRAEYVKLIIEAVKLTDSATTKFLLDSTRAYRNNSKLNGVEGHWINKGGWIDSALAFGLVVPSDYFSNNFEPDKTITRREMAVIITESWD